MLGDCCFQHDSHLNLRQSDLGLVTESRSLRYLCGETDSLLRLLLTFILTHSSASFQGSRLVKDNEYILP